MNNDMPWAQICIIHDEGWGVIGNGYQVTSTSNKPPTLGSRVPVVDVQGVPKDKWQRVLRDYIVAGDVEDIEFLLEDLEKLKEDEQ